MCKKTTAVGEFQQTMIINSSCVHPFSLSGGPQPWLQGGGAAPGGGERLQPLTREDDTAFILQQAAEAQSNRKVHVHCGAIWSELST